MKRMLYLAILSMAILTVSAPAALAQQGGGLCAGASAVTSFSGTTSVDETAPFNISTDTFQVAVETTPTNNSDSAFTSVFVSDSNFTTLTSADFSNILPEDSLSGVIPVDNNGAGPFTLSILPSEASYDITVYECGAAAGDDMDTDNGMTGGMDDDNGVTDDGAPNGMTDDADDMNGGATAGQGAGAVQYDDDADDVGAVQYDDDADKVADDDSVAVLPDTGGPSIMLLGAALLMVAGGLGLATLRARSE